MVKISKITVFICIIFFMMLFSLQEENRTQYSNKDIKGLNLWYKGSIYKFKKEYSEAKKYYIQALNIIENDKLRNEIVAGIEYINKYLGKEGVV